MKEIQFEQLRKIQINILKNFAHFCEENNLAYFLSGGTLLGAVRHKGFIPWDDDIDIMMPRKDYEYAMKNFESSLYQVLSIENNPRYWDLAGRIVDKRTLLQVEYDKNPTGVYIDVFPIDGLPSSKLLQKIEFKLESFFIVMNRSTVLKLQSSHRYKKNDIFSRTKNIIRTGIKFLMIETVGRTAPSMWVRLVHNLAKRYPFSYDRDVAVIVLGHYGMREVVPGSIYANKILVDFEGERFWAPKDYKVYLSQLYGKDYMQLPPVEKQVSDHNFKAYWKDGTEL